MVPNDIAASKCKYNNTYYNSELEKKDSETALKVGLLLVNTGGKSTPK